MAWYDNITYLSSNPFLSMGNIRNPVLSDAFHSNNPLRNNQNINNQNNSGLQWWMNNDRSRWPVSGTNVMPDNLTQDLGAATYRGPLPSVVDESRIPGRIQEELPTKKGFSFNPLNWGIMGMAKKMIEPNTPEENFGRGYFNMDSAGRTYGNQAHDVFAGKNVATGFGKGMGAAAQKRIDRIGNTIQRLTDLDEEKHRQTILNLRNRQNLFQSQQDQYQKDLAGATGGADTPKGPVITSQGDQVNTGGGQRDTSGWSSPGYSTRGGFTGTGGSPGTGQRGHHGNFSQGGRIGLYGGGDPDEPAEDIFEVMQDQNIPFGEQVQGDPFDLRIQELMGKGLSYDDAYDVAAHEFQDLFAEGSEQDQGLASLV